MDYKTLIKTHPRYVSYGLLHSFFSGLGQTFFISLFIPSLLNHFSLSLTQFSGLYFLATCFSALSLPYLGRLIDRINLRIYSRTVGIFLSVALLLMAGAPHWGILLLGLIFLRLTGQSLMTHIASTSMARTFHEQRGKALSLATLGHPLGEALFPPLCAALLLLIGWNWTLIFFFVFLVTIFFPLSHILIKKEDPFLSPDTQTKTSSNSEKTNQFTRRQVLRTAHFYFVIPLAIMGPFLATGLFYHQTLVAQMKGWSIQWLATSFIGFAAFRVVGSILIGPWIDKWTAQRLYAYQLLPMAVGLVFLLWAQHPIGAFLYMSFFGLAIGFEMTVKSAFWAEVYGTKHLGAVRSVVMTIVIYSTALSPILSAWLLDRGVSLTKLLIGAIFLILSTSLLAGLAPSLSSKKPK